MNNDRLIRLPRKGRLIVVTDLHGDYDDYHKYLELWDCSCRDCHIVFAGDLIHSPYPIDKSLEILDSVMNKTRKYPNFHVLLGNHEWSHIKGIDMYKMDKNLNQSFEDLIISKKASFKHTLAD